MVQALRQVLTDFLILIYSAVMTLLWPLARLAGQFHPELRRQLFGRVLSATALRRLAEARANHERAGLFFCSSAGEYEQAKPIIERLERRGFFCVIIFFSHSGPTYARARDEKTPYFLAPPDTVWQWGNLFSAVRPDFAIVVRHELWPAFLSTARRFGALYLIDGSYTAPTKLSRRLKRLLLPYFTTIYVVSEADRREFADKYGLRSTKLKVCGDTKFDRVKERASAQKPKVTALSTKLDRLGRRKRFVIGSAYIEDIHLCFDAYHRLAHREEWQIIVAPHHLKEDFYREVEDCASQYGWSHLRFSALPSEDYEATPDVVIFDTMGQLAELYGCCNIAWVGGAMHRQVHNVLEPASHGLPVAFGPRYHNLVEASQLVTLGGARSFGAADQLAEWWDAFQDAGDNLDMRRTIDQLSGAGDYIVADITGLQSEGRP